jgi:hypothetical protein
MPSTIQALTFDVRNGMPGLTDGETFIPIALSNGAQVPANAAFASAAAAQGYRGGDVFSFGDGVQAGWASDYPLDAPTISGNTITMDELLEEPDKITRDVADLAGERFWMDRVFSAGPGVTGGAVLIERPNPLATDIYGEREPKEIAPGAVFPLQTFVRGVPILAKPKKIGNKWPVTKEAIKRNDTRYLQRQIVQTANTIRRRIENMGVAELQAVIAAETRFITGTDWSAYAGVIADNRVGTSGPVADIMAAWAFMDGEQRGHSANSLLLNTTNAMEALQAFPGMTLQQIFAQAIDPMMGGGSVGEIFVTGRYTLGRALLFESGQVGQWRNEFPLEEETEWEGPAHVSGAQRWWYQWSISPMFFVEDQFSFLEIRGL